MSEAPGRRAAAVGRSCLGALRCAGAFGSLFALPAVLAGCERGCARSWLNEHGVGGESRAARPSGGSPSLNGIDCADGLARCSGGVVEVSRRAVLPQPCHGTPEQCACPWERVGECERACVADGVEAIVDRDRALPQLCAPEPDAGSVVLPAAGDPPRGCDEGQAYRCEGGAVTACRENAVVARCASGCVVEGAGLDDDAPVSREAACAILCSR
jgi:hypothetical protein